MMRKYLEKTFKGSKEEFYCLIDQLLVNNKKTFVITANPETFITAMEKLEFETVLTDVDTTVVADGIGVVKALNMCGYPSKERITGIDLSTHLLLKADEYKKSVYFYGAKQVVLDSLMKKMKTCYPNAVVCGCKNGYDSDSNLVFADMVEKKPDIILVALGIPKQETLIHEHYKKFDKGIFVGVGGSFDVISGMKKRAPNIFIVLKLEWLYRIIKEPKRIKRFCKSNMKFLKLLRKTG